MRLDNIPSNNSLQYKTIGLTSSEIKEITVEKKVGTENNVPLGYVAYEHKPDNAINNNAKFKFNGGIIGGFPGTVDIQDDQPFKVYYETRDTQHTKPLLAYFRTSGGNNHKYYGRGNVWWRRIKEQNSALDANGLGDLFKDEMLKINRRIGFLEFIN